VTKNTINGGEINFEASVAITAEEGPRDPYLMIDDVPIGKIGDRLCLPRVEVVGTIRQAGGIRDLGVVPDITSVQAMEAHEIAVTHLRDTVVAIAGATIVTAGGTTVRTDGAADMINPNQNDRVEMTWMAVAVRASTIQLNQ